LRAGTRDVLAWAYLIFMRNGLPSWQLDHITQKYPALARYSILAF